jgi:hypothetical protein
MKTRIFHIFGMNVISLREYYIERILLNLEGGIVEYLSKL